MSSSTTGLPASPRADGHVLSPISTLCPSNASSTKPSPYADTSPRTIVETQYRRRDSLIFANATIPLSPSSSSSSTSSSPSKENPYQGLAPRKRSAFARLFCCFGREERARRRVLRETEIQKVGDMGHWSEY
ncbi:hypothetical protein ACEQ8H_008056 [Pleosporales sp. CAS-2024a]